MQHTRPWDVGPRRASVGLRVRNLVEGLTSRDLCGMMYVANVSYASCQGAG